MKTVIDRLFYALALPILLIVVWWAATLGSTHPFIPKPVPLVGTFLDTWIGPRFLADVLPSLGRLALGFGIAVVVGIALGVVIGASRVLRKLLEPLLEFLRAVPPPVLLPVLMLVIGIDDRMKIFLIAFGCLWPVVLNTVDGVRATDQVLSDTTRSYRITGAARLRYLLLPGALPRILTGVRMSLPIGIILMVISEMYAASSGLGFTIMYFQRSFLLPQMWSGIVLLGLIGILLAFLFQRVERGLLSWYFGQREVEHGAH